MYGEEGYVYQLFAPLPEFDGYRPALGAWIVGDTSAGLGIRETVGLVTDDGAAFVPHRIPTGGSFVNVALISLALDWRRDRHRHRRDPALRRARRAADAARLLRRRPHHARPAQPQVRAGAPNAVIVTAAGMVSMAFIVVVVDLHLVRRAAGGLLATLIFGLVGIVAQVCGVRLLEWVTGIDIGKVLAAERVQAQACLVGAAHVALGLVVAVAIL